MAFGMGESSTVIVQSEGIDPGAAAMATRVPTLRT